MHKYASDVFFQRFQQITDTIEFNPAWSNGTGYFDYAVCGPSAPKLQSGQIVRCVDDKQRRMILVGTPFGNVVVFQRYTPEEEPAENKIATLTRKGNSIPVGGDVTLVRNIPLQLTTFPLLVAEVGPVSLREIYTIVGNPDWFASPGGCSNIGDIFNKMVAEIGEECCLLDNVPVEAILQFRSIINKQDRNPIKVLHSLFK